MRSHAGIASRMFEILANEGINILMIATSEIKISVVVDEKYLELGVRALHEGFDLKKQAIKFFNWPNSSKLEYIRLARRKWLYKNNKVCSCQESRVGDYCDIYWER